MSNFPCFGHKKRVENMHLSEYSSQENSDRQTDVDRNISIRNSNPPNWTTIMFPVFFTNIQIQSVIFRQWIVFFFADGSQDNLINHLLLFHWASTGMWSGLITAGRVRGNSGRSYYRHATQGRGGQRHGRLWGWEGKRSTGGARRAGARQWQNRGKQDRDRLR